MISPKFRLRSDYISKDGSRSILLFITKDSQRFRYSTGLDIKPQYWNKEKQRPKITTKELRNYPSYSNQLVFHLEIIHNQLDKIETFVQSIYTKWTANNIELDFKKLKSELDKQVKSTSIDEEEKSKDHVNFETYLDQFIEGIKTGTITNDRNNLRYSLSTVKAYSNLKYRLELYKKSRNIRRLDYASFDMDWYQDYSKYALSEGYQQSSINNTIKNLKSVLNRAKEKGHHKEKKYLNARFKKVKVDTKKIALSTSEVQSIIDLDLEEFKHLEKYKDVFLVGCFSGLRFSDLMRIKPHHIKKEGERYYIDMITLKTKQIVIIPMNRIVRNIMKKYNYKLPFVTEQKTNKNIKKIGQLASINEMIESKTIQRSDTKIVTVPKYKLITTHTARRTAITQMYLQNIPTIDIMKISGHKTEQQLLHYIKQSEKETANRLSDHSFFK